MLKARGKIINSKRSDIILFSVLWGLCFLSFIRFLDTPDNWFVDILSNFPVQYALLAVLFLAICLWKKKIALAIIAGLLSVVNVSALVEFGSTAQAAVQKDASFKVYSANIEKTNTDFTKLVGGLMAADADILLLLEVTVKHVNPLQPLIEAYPYQIINLNTGLSGTGTVLLSRFPVLDHNVTQYSEFGNILVSATLDINGKKVAFYAAHFPRPIFGQQAHTRSKQFVLLAEDIKSLSIPVIVAGDMNATPYSPLFRKLLKTSGLRDSRSGFGWLPSWPTYCLLCWLPIDHILVSPDIQVVSRSTGSNIGSDHFPAIAELSL